jgi:monovalent cation:H+ antiporter-2, CPA2 family
LLGGAAVASVALLVLRRRLIYWHSELEVGLHEALADASPGRLSSTSVPWLGRHEEWKLGVTECIIPDLASCSGNTLGQLNLRARFGCTVVGIERQGCMIALPGPEQALFPRDKVLFLGAPENAAAAKAFFSAVSAVAEGSDFDVVGLESVTVPPGSRASGYSLSELAPAALHGVQIVGLRRGGARLLSPGADERVGQGDELLALGTPVKLRAFKAWVREPVEPAVGA